MLISEEYFKGEIVIPNLRSTGKGISNNIAESNLALLELFIDKYENRFLELLLGKYRAVEFSKEIEKGELSGKWLELKNILVDETLKESPIANYVYYWYIRNNTTTTTGVGEVETISDNSKRVSPSLKMVRAWNEMVDKVKHVAFWLHDREDFDYKPCDSDIFHKINVMNI